MTPTASWNPEQYLRFADERLRPALDLLARVPIADPKRIVDLGCGAGNVTAVLANRFPKAALTGVDASAEMLTKARTAAPGCRFVAADIATWRPDPPSDLIFSNAALHWISDHETLFPRFMSLLPAGGVLAVQMPAMHDAPLRRLQQTVAATGPWAERLRGCASAGDILTANRYWELLRPHAAALDVWETCYLHALRGEDAVVEWASGSSLRPFLSALPAEQAAAFRRAYGDAIRPAYPCIADGTTLLPFKRLFLIAERA